MERISITVSEELLRELDRILREKECASRSEGLRDAIRKYIAEQKILDGLKGDVAGSINLIYDHSAPKILERLIDTQHHFSDVIDSSLHVHLDRGHCMEAIVVRGEGERVKELINRLSSIKGVKHAKLEAVPGVP